VLGGDPVSGRTASNLEPCGTLAAARRHRRHGERLCEKCLPVDHASKQAYRQDQPGSPDFRRVRNGIPWKPYVYRGLGYDLFEVAA
jgi:hypothetical protein